MLFVSNKHSQVCVIWFWCMSSCGFLRRQLWKKVVSARRLFGGDPREQGFRGGMRERGKKANTRCISKPVTRADDWKHHSGICAEQAPELSHHRSKEFIPQLHQTQAGLLLSCRKGCYFPAVGTWHPHTWRGLWCPEKNLSHRCGLLLHSSPL